MAKTTATKAPARNASRAKWADWLTQHDIDVPDGATRDDLAELWTLNEDDAAPVDVDDTDTTLSADESRRADILLGNDQRPSPNAALADQVPDEYRFSTDSGRREDPDKLLISLDEMACYLYKPSSTLMIIMAASFTPGADPLEKVRAMLNLVNASLDAQGRILLHRMMTAGDASFDDGLVGKLAWVILNKWAPTLAQDADLNTDTTPAPANRAARRRAAKSK